MHERTTRAIARWLFVGCCAFPTSLTMLAILVTWTPWYDNRARTWLEDELALRTGLLVEVASFERTDPSTWILSGVELFHPETLASVATVRAVSWTARSDITVIKLSQPEIRIEHVHRVATMIHDRFLCRPDQTRVPVRLAADDLTLRGTSVSQTLQDLDGWLQTRDGTVWATIECVPAGQRPDAAKLEIEVNRDRTSTPPTTAYAVQTGDLQLPVGVLADYFPALKRLGTDATFQGTLTARKSDDISIDPWSLQLTGNLREVDLSKVTEALPHRLTGQATISLDRCEIQREGGVNISGELRSSSGYMSASLLPRLAEDLGCRLTMMIDQGFNFDALAVRFDLYAAQLRVEGICQTQPGLKWLQSDVLVTSGGHPVVKTTQKWLHATNLARLVAPSHSVSVPLSGQTSGLLSILKLPSHQLPLSAAVHLTDTVAGSTPPLAEGMPPSMLPTAPPIMDSEGQPSARIGRLSPYRDERQSISQPY